MDERVTDNPAKGRYELAADGAVAIAAYEQHGNVIAFLHTKVPEELEGRGIASRLIACALDDVRAKGLTIEPLCSFVAAYVERHPEVRDLVAEH